MVDLGADGLVSFMGFRPETYARYGAKVLMIPGVKTYNEALGQLELGADFIKFPGNSPWGAGLLSSALSATHGLFPVLVTGGCTLEKIAEFIKSGAVLLASGFDVILKSKALDEETVTRKLLVWAVRGMLSEVRQARSLYQPRLYEAVETGADNPLSAGGWIS
jgi:2-keto-3-deoxy-6-phosphogluconate aldolase